MANTMKIIKKNFFKTVYPEIGELNLVLETSAGIFYAWKNGTCIKYDYNKDPQGSICTNPKRDRNTYYKDIVCNGLNHPLQILQYHGYWSTDMLVIKDFGEYIGIIIPRCQTLKVGEFTKDEAASRITKCNYYNSTLREYRIYKDRKVAIVHYSLTNNEYIGYIFNPKFKSDNRWENGYWSAYNFLGDGETTHDRSRSCQEWERADSNGNYKWLDISTVNVYDFAAKPSSSNSRGFTSSCFYVTDYLKGWAQPIALSDHGHTDYLKLSDATIKLFDRFFKNVDKSVKDNFYAKYKTKKIEYMGDLCNFLTCPDAEHAAKQIAKRQNEKDIYENLCNTLTWNLVDRGLAFDRIDDKIYVTCYRDDSNTKHSGWDSHKGQCILIYDLKKKSKKLFVKRTDQDLVTPIPSEEAVTEWFNVDPRHRYGWGYGDEGVVDDAVPHVWVKPMREVFAGTNIQYFLDICPDDLKINYGLVKGDDKEFDDHNINNVKQLVCEDRFSKYAWDILFSTKDCIAEQTLKSGLLYLFMARLVGDGFRDLDNNGYGGWSCRIGYHKNAKSLKKCYDLSINQLRIIDEYIKVRYNKYQKRSGYGYDGNNPPLVPPVLGLDKIFNIETKCIDLPTFTKLIELGDQKSGSYDYFSWSKLSDYTALMDITHDMAPRDIFEWLGKGYNLEQYNDYLKMRSKLKQIAKDTNQPQLFNEKAYPIKVKDPKDVKRLHDICEKITFEYQDRAKAQMFRSAVTEAKKYVWEDKKDQPDRMMIVVPENVSDLVYEGTELNHCVKSPMWIDAIAERSSTIVFIRRCDAKDVPFFTVELNKHGAIRQCHGQCNCNPTPEVINFLHRWADAKKSVVKKDSITSSYGALCAPRG